MKCYPEACVIHDNDTKSGVKDGCVTKSRCQLTGVTGRLQRPRGDWTAEAETSACALSCVTGTGLRTAFANSTIPLRLWKRLTLLV